MDRPGKKMDDFCAITQRLLAWLEPARRVPLHFVGNGRSYSTAPAPYIELVYMEKGGCSELTMGDRMFAIPAGHVAMHNAHFGSVSPEVGFFAWCAFLYVGDVPELADLGEMPWLCSMPITRPIQWRESFQRLMQRGRSSGWVSPRYPPTATFRRERNSTDAHRSTEIFVKTALLDILALLLEEAQSANTSAGSGTNDPQPEVVRRAISFMQLHYGKADLCLDDIAKDACINVDHFGRLFARSIGEPPMRHLRRIRIMHSSFLLQQTDLRIQQIARDVGFDDPYHFSRAFKAVQGVSPRAWRQAYRKPHA